LEGGEREEGAADATTGAGCASARVRGRRREYFSAYVCGGEKRREDWSLYFDGLE